MGTAILRGISTGLLVTLLTLLGGVIWETMGLGGLKVTSLVDVGLFLSCLIGGFRAARDGGHWMIGAVAGAGYVAVSTLLLALFAPVSGAGVVQLLAEGALLGGLGGVIGTGAGGGRKVRPVGNWESWRVNREYNREHDREYNREHDREYNREHDREYAQEYAQEYDREYDRENGRGDGSYDNDALKQVNSLQDQDHDYRTHAVNPDRTHPWWEEEAGGIQRIG